MRNPQDREGPLRMGRMTALRKRTGGVRGIVVGEILRRLVTRTIAQSLGDAFKTATAPHQYTRSGKAPHHQARASSFEERPRVRRCSPFRAAVLRPTFQLHLEDEMGEVHDILQGEGGEQGDPLMPALFALGQQEALEAI